MNKLKLGNQGTITFEEGCNLYLQNCRQRNLREATIRHYKQSYTQFYKFFPQSMPLTDITAKKYGEYVLYLQRKLDNDVSINSYLRDLITTLRFLMNEGYMPCFAMKSIKVDKHSVETYTEDELRLLLKKPDMRKCTFSEYQCWVMTNFLFSTGVRQRSLNNILVKDIDFDNGVVYVRVTKTRKPLLIPLGATMLNILREYLRRRQHKSVEEYLFSNVFGQQLVRSTSYSMLYNYNKSRGVNTTGIHRYRHTFAKQWILNGGNVVTLSRLLGHSNLAITQNYINILVTDLAKQVEEICLLDKYAERKQIKLDRI